MEEVRMRRGGEDDQLRSFETKSGIAVKSLYRPEDVAGVDYERDLGNPGQYPYTRGRFPDGYRGKLWLRNQIAGYGTSEEAREAYKYLVRDLYVTGIRIASDYTTQAGIDPDHPLALGSVGEGGTTQYCLAELEKTLSGISLLGGAIDLPAAGSWAAAPLYAMLIALCEKRGADLAQLRGDMVNDSLHCYIGDYSNTQPFDIGWRLQIESMEYGTEVTPNFYVCNPCAYDLSENGADTIMELAIALAERIAYIDAVLERGVPFAKIATRMVMGFAADIDFFETVCKLRAARRIWARIARERYGAPDDPRITVPTIDLTCSGHSTAARQPILNVARTTIEALAAVLAGCQSLGIRPYDEAIYLPSWPALGVAAQIHHVIAHETGVPLVADPLGGSYYVEWLTSEIERRVLDYMQKIEEHGGVVEATKSGWLTRELEEGILRRESAFQEGRRVVVNANAFHVPQELEVPLPTFQMEEAHEKKRGIAEACKQYKQSRDLEPLKGALLSLYRAARGSDNVLPAMVEAARAGATHGEIMGVVREGMGHGYDPFGIIERPPFLSYD